MNQDESAQNQSRQRISVFTEMKSKDLTKLSNKKYSDVYLEIVDEWKEKINSVINLHHLYATRIKISFESLFKKLYYLPNVVDCSTHLCVHRGPSVSVRNHSVSEPGEPEVEGAHYNTQEL